MRAALATTVLAAGIAVAGTAPATAKSPSRGQITRAVASAERSRSLWATVNICDSRAYPDRIGVRGQMPSLGYPAQMTMTIALRAYSTTAKRFKAIDSPNAVNAVTLGTHSRGLQQSGAVFPFAKGDKGLWDATIVFTWRRSGRIVGQTTRTTTAGHPNADYGSPPHYSAAQCRLS